MFNSYYAKGLNAIMNPIDFACLRIGLYDKVQKFLLMDMLWYNATDRSAPYNNLHRFGSNKEGEFYIELKYKDFIFSIEFAGEQDKFSIQVDCISGQSDDISFFISPAILYGASGEISVKNDIEINTTNANYKIKTIGERISIPINTEYMGISYESDKKLVILCNTDEIIKQKETKPSSGGYLQDSVEAIKKVLAWNTIYDHTKNRLITPVSRAWCTRNGSGFGSYVLFDWDTFFAGVMSGTFSRDIAYMQVESIMQEVMPNGIIPNFGSERGGSPDRSQPPVGSYCILKLYRQFGDISLIKKHYEALLKWNLWWAPNRDGNKDGLLEWGSNPIENGVERGYFDNGATHLCAMYESGLDNSPMYDNAEFDVHTNTLRLNDVGLNALYALDCQSLAIMAGILGKTDDKLKLEAEYQKIKNLMNETMYDKDIGMYCNTFWDGKKDYTFSPTNFYPILAQIPNEEQLEKIIKNNLMNEDKFWGKYIIPSISKDNPAYFDQDYWRGRIWGPMNYLVYEGLRRAKRPESKEFAKKSFDLFLLEWQKEGHIHENYNSITGEGCDRENADPFYTWGALLAYLPICEYIYIPIDGDIEINLNSMPEAFIKDFPIGEDFYSLDTTNGAKLYKNGVELCCTKVDTTNCILIKP